MDIDFFFDPKINTKNMAIINSILKGQLRGRIGNTWFSHAKNSKGRPVTRAGSINENPSNPKTFEQMKQRAKFANAVKFYTRATQNFFRFAFEDKRANESDYNAFMRHNIDRSYVLPKSSVDESMFPALGNRWLMSQGTLPLTLSLDTIWDKSKGTIISLYVDSPQIDQSLETWINDGVLQKGDIITIVLIASYVTTENATTLDDVYSTPQWQIFQFVADPERYTDWKDIPSVGYKNFNMNYSKGDEELQFVLNDSNYSVWSTLIITRKKNSKLQATTSYLMPNVPGIQLESMFQGSETINNSLASWGAQNKAILKGGIATRTDTNNEEPSPSKTEVFTVNGVKPPYEIKAGITDHMSIKVTGSNLPNVSPESEQNEIITVQDFELNDAKTEAYFSIVKGGKYGSFSIKYAGQIILNGHTAEDTDA